MLNAEAVGKFAGDKHILKVCHLGNSLPDGEFVVLLDIQAKDRSEAISS